MVLVLSDEPVNNLQTIKLVCTVTGSTGEARKMSHLTNNTSHLLRVFKFVTWHAEFLTTEGNAGLLNKSPRTRDAVGYTNH